MQMFHSTTISTALTECRLAIVFIATTLLITDTVQAGVCWRRVGSNGRCQELLMADIDKEECCSMSGAWSPHEVSQLPPGQLFFWNNLAGGAPDCERCHASCDTLRCDPDKRCRMKNGVPRCTCSPDCSSHHARHRGEQCGTDGITYRSKCSMLKHNCRNSEQVETNYFGSCKTSCSDVTCQRGQTCVTDQNGAPHCVRCFTNCPEPETPDWRCGSNGVSYPSLCHIRSAICLSNAAVTIAYTGRCRDAMTCDDLSCISGEKCLVHPQTTRPQCVTCGMDCTSERVTPVCGTDGITYPSWCELRRTACELGIVIQTQHSGPCEQESHIISNNIPALEISDEATTPADHPAEIPAPI